MKEINYTIPYSYKLKYVNGKSKKDIEELGLNSYGQFDSDELPSSSMQIDANVSYDEAKERVEEEINERYKGILEIDDFWIGDSDVKQEERVRVRTDLPLEEIELKDIERSGKWDDSYSRLCDELATYKKGGALYDEDKFAKGGKVEFTDLSDYSRPRKIWENRKSKKTKQNSIGSFAHRYNGKYVGDYYLYHLDYLDEDYYSHIPLKEGEILARVETDMFIGGEMPLVKINILNGRVYFMSDENDLYSDEDDKNPKFNRASADVIYLSLDKYILQYLNHKNYLKNRSINYEEGGGVGRKDFYHIGEIDGTYYVMHSVHIQPNFGGQILESGFSTKDEAIKFAEKISKSDSNSKIIFSKGGSTYAEGGAIGNRFELGTPVNYRTEDYSGNERIESGEVVLRNGKKAIKLYKDRNYSGDGERIRFFDEIDMSQVKSFYDTTYAEGGYIENDIKQLKNLPSSHRYTYVKNFSDERLKNIADELYLDYEEYDDIQSRIIRHFDEEFAKGGSVARVKTIVYSPMGEVSLDEYRNLSNEDMMGKSMMNIDEVKDRLFSYNDEAYDYEDEIRKIDNVDELADFLYENNLAQVDNTYNQSWWGGVRMFSILNNNGDNYDSDYPTIIFLSKHRGGDVRGNYEKFEAFDIGQYGYEEIPFVFATTLTYEVRDGDKKAVFGTQDMEGYELYVVESDFVDFDEGDSTNVYEVEQKLGISLY
jgi:hypothetical protein